MADATSQPTGTPVINTANSITSGLLIAEYPPVSGRGSTTTAFGEAYTGAAPAPVAGGPTFSPNISGSGGLSILAVAVRVAAGDDNFRKWPARVRGGGINSVGFGVGLDEYSQNRSPRAVITYGDSDSNTVSTSGSYLPAAAGQQLILGATYQRNNAAGLRLFVDGSAAITSVTQDKNIFEIESVLYASDQNGGSENTSVPATLVALWSRTLSDAEMASLHANPWQIFEAPTLTIEPPLLTNSPTLYAPTVTGGSPPQILAPSLLTSSPTLYSPSVAVVGFTAAYVLANTAPTGGNVAGAMYEVAGLVSPSDYMTYTTVSGPTPGGGTLVEYPDGSFDYTNGAPAIWVIQIKINGVDYFETTTVYLYDQEFTLLPPLLDSTPTLYAPTVTASTQTLAPPLLDNTPTLYAPTVRDASPPTLTLPTGVSTSATTGAGTVVTNEATGTLFYWATLNATELQAAVISAGASQPVTAAGLQAVSVGGLTTSATYYLHYVHRDGATNDSARVSSTSFVPTAVVSVARASRVSLGLSIGL